MSPKISPNTTASQAICRLPQLLQLTGLGRSSIYARLDPRSRYYDPSFPRPVPLHGPCQMRGAVGWPLGEVLTWLEAQAAKRTHQGAHHG